MKEKLIGLIPLCGGLICVGGAVFSWRWFIESESAKPVVGAIGRRGARILYFVLGMFLVLVGVFVLTGSITMPRKYPRELRLNDGTTRKIVTVVEPEYSAQVRSRRADVKVIVRVWISKEGLVTETKIAASPDPELSTLAIEAVRKWRFEAGDFSDPMIIEIPIEFHASSSSLE